MIENKSCWEILADKLGTFELEKVATIKGRLEIEIKTAKEEKEGMAEWE